MTLEETSADCESLTTLGHQIVELAGHLNAAHHRFLMLIAEWDRRKGWNDGLHAILRALVVWKCGIDMGAAREKVRTAHALANLPNSVAKHISRRARS
jgi:hypothetical protein